MKYIFLILCFASPALAEQVRLPDDSNKLYVSVFAGDAKQAKVFVARHPEIARYAAGNHYNVYVKSDPLFVRFAAHVQIPCAIVQTADGSVTWSSCPLRRCPKPVDVDVKINQPEPEPEPEPQPVDEPVSPWLYVGLAAAGLAAGAGMKFYQELKA